VTCWWQQQQQVVVLLGVWLLEAALLLVRGQLQLVQLVWLLLVQALPLVLLLLLVQAL